MRVIVTGAGALLGQGVIRSIRRSNLSCHVIGVDPSRESAGLYWCDAAYQGRNADDPDFLPTLRKIIETERADVVIPGTDAELPILSKTRGELEAQTGCKILVSDPEVVRIADDKLATSQFFRAYDFAHPATALLDDAAGVAEIVDAVGFPLIVKPRIGARSIGVRRIDNFVGLDVAMTDPRGLILQELIGDGGPEYTACGLYFNNACDGSIVMRRDLKDGNTYRARIDSDPELDDWVRRWTIALKPMGSANFQFRRRPDGTPVVFEINARFSGTTPLRAHAGFNEVEMSLNHLVHNHPITPGPIREIVVLRHWSETVVSAEQIDAVRSPD